MNENPNLKLAKVEKVITNTFEQLRSGATVDKVRNSFSKTAEILKCDFGYNDFYRILAKLVETRKIDRSSRYFIDLLKSIDISECYSNVIEGPKNLGTVFSE
jgi:hypothetical protein